MCKLRLLPALILVSVFLPGPADARDTPRKEPGARATGKLYEWQTSDGLVFLYRIPRDYDPEGGANLTVLLHGSNLTRGWGFANHSHKTFRPDDIVVSPDGTTSNGSGGFNFLGKKPDVDRFHALLEELKGLLKVRAVYLYGHSQGSFFAFHYAGEHPDDVQGIAGHASGVWTWTQGGRKGHHQAVVLMHGTQDPVVPYGQSLGGLEWFREKKYPTVRMRHLEGWNHWPAEHNSDIPHTSQQLAWCEGMSTTAPDRLEAALETLADVKAKEWHDYAALYAVAVRIAGLEGLPAKVTARAEKARGVVSALASAHVEALDLEPTGELEKGAWVGHLPVFLRAFEGVPAADALAERWEKVLEKQKKDALKHMKKYWQALNKGDRADAFAAGVDALAKGFLLHFCWDRQFRNNLAAWRKDARTLKIHKRTLKAYDELIEQFEKSLTDGFKAFEGLNRKVGKI